MYPPPYVKCSYYQIANYIYYMNIVLCIDTRMQWKYSSLN